MDRTAIHKKNEPSNASSGARKASGQGLAGRHARTPKNKRTAEGKSDRKRNTVLLKRLPRLLKKDAVRYGGLLVLIAAMVYVVIATMCAADTTIKGLNKAYAEADVEDGQFTALVELTDDEVKMLQDAGLTIERHYSLDVKVGDGATLRVFKNRELIDRVTLSEGRFPQGDNEIIVERNYARVHNYTVGSMITIDDKQFRVCGIGTTPDYEAVTETLADANEKPMQFGVAFVADATFESLKESDSLVRAVEYTYAYLLNGKMTNAELSIRLASMRFDVREANNEYLQEVMERGGEAALHAQEEIKLLSSSSGALSSGANELAGSLNAVESYVNDLMSSIQTEASDQESIQIAVNNAKVAINLANQQIDTAEAINDVILESAQIGLSGVESALAYLDPESSTYAELVAELSSTHQSFVDAVSYCQSQYDVLAQTRNMLDDTSSRVDTIASEVRSVASSISSIGGDVSSAVSGLSSGANTLSSSMSEFAAAVDEFGNNSGEYLNSMMQGTLAKAQEFTPRVSNGRMGNAVLDEDMFSKISGLLGAFGLIMVSFALGVVLNHILQKEQVLIGTLYAMGVKRRELLASYLAVPVTVAFTGGVLGTIIGLTPLGVGVQMTSIIQGYSIPDVATTCPIWVIAVGLFAPPLIAGVVNYLSINNKVARPVLDLLSDKPKSARQVRGNWLSRLSFVRMFQARQIMRESRSVVTMVGGMLISLMLVMIGVDCALMYGNAVKAAENEVPFEHQYLLKYAPAEVPEGGEAMMAESLALHGRDSHVAISLIGVQENSEYFSLSPLSGKKEVAVSSAVADKFGIKQGQEVVLDDRLAGLSYTFTVKEIFDYNPSFVVCMNIADMRTLFGQDETYYNMVMSQNPLTIDAGRVYSHITHAGLVDSAKYTLSRNIYTIGVFLLTPIVIFAILLYLLMNVMARNNSMGISLLKVFGYRSRDLHRMYLQGNGAVIAISAVIFIPLSKILVDYLFGLITIDAPYTFLVTMPWWGYVAVFAFVLLCYFAISAMLRASIRAIDCDRVLRGRE